MNLIIQNTALSNKVSQVPTVDPLAVSVVVPNITGGSVTYSNFYSASLEVTNGAANWNDHQIETDFGVTLENLTPAVMSLDSNKRLTRIIDGLAVIRATKGTRRSTLRLGTQLFGATRVEQFNGWVAATASDMVSDEVLALWVGGKTNPIFSTKNDTTATYVKDSNCWANGIELSGLAVCMSYDGGTTWTQANASCAITPRHIVGARHWNIDYSNAKVRFRANDGSVVERAIIGKSTSLGTGDDLIVLTLAGPDLPETVVPFDIVGEWFRTNFSNPYGGNLTSYWCGAYAFAVNQNYNAIGMMIGHGASFSQTMTVNGTGVGSYYNSIPASGGEFALSYAANQLTAYADFFAGIISGDSGKPTFLLDGGVAKLLGVFYSAFTSSFVGALDGDVTNAHIASADSNAGVSTGYTVTVAADPTL